MKLELKNPVSPRFVNQKFGEDPITYARFGIKGHNGLDLRAYHGQPVYASHDGIANYQVDKDQGHGVVVISQEKFDLGKKYGEKQVKTIYWHFCDSKKEPKFASPIYRKKNVKVKVGQLLGYADNTGFSNGDHLHYGLKAVDAKGNTLFVDNGYKGAIDPWPYMEASDELKKQVQLLSTVVSLYKRILHV